MRGAAGQTRSARIRRGGWVLLVLLAAAYYIAQVRPLLHDHGTGITGLASHQNDYKHVYLGAVLLNRGLSPYDRDNMLVMAGDFSAHEDPRFRTILPYVYLPFTGMVLTPLTWLPFGQSAVAFMMVNHALVLAGIFAIAGSFRRAADPWLLCFLLAAAALNVTLYRQNNAGQLNAVLLGGFALLWLGMSRRWHDGAIGSIAAFLALFKLSPGILLFYFILRRQWMRAVWMIGACLLLMLVSVGIYGLRVHLDFAPVLGQMGYGSSTWAEDGHTFWRDPYNMSVNALFHRLLVERDGAGATPWLSLSHGAANALTWLVSAGLMAAFAAVLLRRKGAPAGDTPAAFSAAVCLSLLLPSIMWDHYLVQLLVPMGLLWMACTNQRRGSIWRLVLIAALCIAAVPVPFQESYFRGGLGLLLANLKLLPVFICFIMSLMFAWRETAGPHPS